MPVYPALDSGQANAGVQFGGSGQPATIPLYAYGKHKHGEVIRKTLEGSYGMSLHSKHTEKSPCTLLVGSRTRSTGLETTNGLH